MKRSFPRSLALALGALILGAALSAHAAWPLPVSRPPTAAAQVQTAWRAAAQADGFRFVSDVAQTTFPAPLTTNVGRSSRTETLHLEGEVDNPNHLVQMTVWNGAGLGVDQSESVELRFVNGQAFGRATGDEWQEFNEVDASFSASNDALNYLVAAKNIRALEVATDTVDIAAVGQLTHFGFDVDGPALAEHMRALLETELARRGELPPGVSLSTPELYFGAQGVGEVWMLAGRPARLSVHVEFPRQPNGERVTMEVTTSYTDYRVPADSLAQSANPMVAGLMAPLWRALESQWPASPADWQNLSAQWAAGLLSVSLVMLVMAYRRKRPVYATFIGLMVFSMTFGPVLEAQQVFAFTAKQNARVAEAAQPSASAADPALALLQPEWNPNQNPLPNPDAQSDPSLSPIQNPKSPTLNLSAASASALLPDDDADGDGLTNVQEERLGTDPKSSDTDLDNLSDKAEVNGFTHNNKQWYSNPLEGDTNYDGLPDSAECSARAADPAASCPDSDGDLTPDIFDLDNDNDGVNDNIDLSPNSFVGTAQRAFSNAAPFQFNLSNLQTKTGGGAYSVLMEFQLRPAKPQRLWYASNVYDWPVDTEGQIQRPTTNTFASSLSAANVASDPRSLNGDVRLMPMLEIEMGGSALPLPLTTPYARQAFDNRTITGTIPANGLISGTLTLTPTVSGTNSQLTFTFADAVGYEITVITGTCSAGGAGSDGKELKKFTSVTSNTPLTVPARVTQLADGRHVVKIVNGKREFCVSLFDIPNGPYPDKMVDTAALQPYGLSARDTGAGNKVIVYAPLSIVTDPATGERVGFSTRLLYSSQSAGWVNNQTARVMWLVQVLVDGGGATLAHTYYDEWYLTGLQAQEDRGLKVGLMFEDPAHDANSNSDDPLVTLASGLDQVFRTGRDANYDGQRDLTIEGIKARFDNASNSGTSNAQRWNLSQNAFRVFTYTYPAQDYIAHIMMTETVKALNTYLSGVTSPLLLLAQERRGRTVNLDQSGLAQVSNGASVQLSFDPAQVNETVLASLTMTPYHKVSGQWAAYTIAEYINVLGARFQKLSLFADKDATLQQVKTDTGIGLYVAYMVGQSGMVELGEKALAGSEAPEDSALEKNLRDGALKDLVSKVGQDFSDTSRLPAGARWRSGAANLKNLMKSSNGAMYGAMVGMYALKLASIGTKKDSAAAHTLLITANVVGVVVAAIDFAKTANDAVKAVKAVGSLSKAASWSKAMSVAKPMSKLAKGAAVVGLIISVGLTWGVGIYQLATGDMSGLQMRALIAQLVAETIVAVILFAIGLIPIVGQIIVAVIALLDALAYAICAIVSAATGKDVEKSAAGKRLCKGFTGLLTAIVGMFIYGQRALISNVASAKRLDIDFNQGLTNANAGFVEGNVMRFSLALTNTIQGAGPFRTGEEWEKQKEDAFIPLPFDPLALPYLWQFSEPFYRKTVFIYATEITTTTLSVGDLGSMSSQWKNAGGDKYRIAKTMTVQYPLGSAGINRGSSEAVMLAEGRNIPTQECFLIPLVWIPVCYISGDKHTNHIPMAEKQKYDVLPATLDGFTALTPKDGGYSLQWGQTGTLTFARQKDADGDGLLNSADQGNDPNDSLYDTDSDGVPDGVEIQNATDATKADTDNDGLTDKQEALLKTDPLQADSDNDGLTDKQETDGWPIIYGRDAYGKPLGAWVTSDPGNANADDDVWRDDMEKALSFSPWAWNDENLLDYSTQIKEAGAPRGLWRFEEDAGATAFANASGYDIAGACTSAACPTAAITGRYGRGALFNNTYGHAIHTEKLTTSGVNFTLAVWAKRGDLNRAQTLLSYGPNLNNWASLSVGADNRVVCALGAYQATSTAAWTSTTAWTHWACAFNGGSLTLYRDGQYENSAGAYAGSNPGQPDSLTIGNVNSGNAFFNGALDDAVLYDRATPSITSLMEGRFNPDDRMLAPNDTLTYQAMVGNRLFAKYIDGVLTPKFAAATTSSLAPLGFRLDPGMAATLLGNLTIRSDAVSGPLSLTLAAAGNVVDRRATSGSAEARLKLDDPAQLFADTSGNIPQRNGSCYPTSACPTLTEGPVGNAVDFDGVDDMVRVDGIPFIDHFTFALWAKRSRSGVRETLITHGWAGTQELAFLPDGRLECRVADNAVLRSDYQDAAEVGKWAHWACTYDFWTTEVTLYKNGQRIANNYVSERQAIYRAAVYLGRNPIQYLPADAFSGDLADVRIFRVVLDDTQVRTLTATPTARYNFDNNWGASFLNSADPVPDPWNGYPNACHDLNGGTKNAVAWGNGLFKDGLYFDGGTYCDLRPGLKAKVANNGTASFNEVTLSFWYKPEAATEMLDQERLISSSSDSWWPCGNSNTLQLSYTQSDFQTHQSKLTFYFPSGGQCEAVAFDALQANMWNHIALTLDANRLGRMYVNGQLKLTHQFANNGQPVKVGSRVGWISNNNQLPLLQGWIDDWQVIAKALTINEVSQVMLETAGRLYLRMDDVPNNGRFINANNPNYPLVAYGTETPAAGVDGVIGRGAQFDGEDDRLPLYEFALDARASFTLAAWAKRDAVHREQYIVGPYWGSSSVPHMGFDANDRFVCGWGGNRVRTDNAFAASGVWEHWTCSVTYSPTRDVSLVTLYRNGSVIKTGELPRHSGAQEAIYVGWGAVPSPLAYFKGTLDEVRVLAAALDGTAAGYGLAPFINFKFEETANASLFRNSTTGNLEGWCGHLACPSSAYKGKVELAARFDGQDDSVRLAYNWSLADSFTAAVWARRDALKRKEVLLSMGTTLKMGVDENNKFYCQRAGNVVYSSQPWADMKFWTHWACLYDASARTLTLYQNGLAVGTQKYVWPSAFNGDVWLGSNANTGEFFAGAMDEAQIYNRVLTQAEFKALYESQKMYTSERQEYGLTIDAEAPTARLVSPLGYYANTNTVLQLGASDRTSYVAQAELGAWYSGDNTTLWTGEPCLDTKPGTAWCPTFMTRGEGRYTLSARTTDAVGRQALTSLGDIYVDGTPPQFTSDIPSGSLVPLPTGETALTLAGNITDPDLPGAIAGSGVLTTSVRVTLFTPEGEVAGLGSQPAVVNGTRWSATYPFGSLPPTGQYTLRVEADDKMRNHAQTNVTTFIVDALGPKASLQMSWPSIITSTTPLTGVVTELPAPVNATLAWPFEEEAGRTWFSGETAVNLALGQLAAQSSLAPGRPAERAVDGWIDAYNAANSAQTESENQPWWQVDLGAPQPLTSIQLWRSPDASLTGLRVSLSNDPSGAPAVWSVDYTGADNASLLLPVADANGHPVVAQYARVQLLGSGVLALAEAQVFGLIERYGVCTGATCPTAGQAGRAGQAVRFDGVDDALTASRPVTLTSASFSMAAWAQRGDSGREQIILEQGATPSTPNQTLSVGFRANDKFFCDFGGNALESSAAYPQNDWTHWACVYDREAGLRWLYRNGVQVAQDAITVAVAYAGVGPVMVGAGLDASRAFNGALDEVSFYQRALDAIELRALAQPQVSGLQSTELYFESALPGSTTYTDTQDATSGRPAVRLDFEKGLQDTSGSNQPIQETPLTVWTNFSSATGSDARWSWNTWTWEVWRWWDVDLGVSANLQSLDIAQCQDVYWNCRDHRLTNYYLYLSDTPLPAPVINNTGVQSPANVWARYSNASASYPNAHETLGYGARGRYLRILTKNDWDGVERIGVTFSASARQVAGAEGQWAREFQANATSPILAGAHNLNGASFSIGAWVRRGDAGREQYVLKQGVRAGQASQTLRLGFLADDRFACAFNGDDLVTSISYPQTNEWTHWACVYDAATNTRVLYRNAVEVARDNPAAPYQGNGALYIGDDGFTGAVDDIRLYRRALSATDLAIEFSVTPWQATTLSPGGVGSPYATWTASAPAGLEGEYYLNLRGQDTGGVRAQSQRLWHGTVDTTAPRILSANRFNRRGLTYHAFRVQDFYLSETNYQMSTACTTVLDKTGPYLDDRQYYQTAWYQELAGHVAPKLYLGTVYCAEVGVNLPPQTLTACDVFGNCASASSDMLDDLADSTLLAYVLSVPLTMTTHAPITISVAATTTFGSLQGLTLNLNDNPLALVDWLSDTVTSTVWSTEWTPPEDAVYVFTAEALRWDTTQPALSPPAQLIVDIVPPEVDLAPTVFTATHLSDLQLLPFTGVVTENVGIATARVQVGNLAVLTPTLNGQAVGPFSAGPWETWWKPSPNVFDGVAVPVTVTVVDRVSYTASASHDVWVDLVKPPPVILTVSHQGTPLIPNTTLTATAPTLQLDWTASSDGSGLAPYQVGWSVNDGEPVFQAFDPNGPRQTFWQPPEATRVYAHIFIADTVGNATAQVIGPFYIDAPTTPDYIEMTPDPADLYLGWMDNSCSLLGADNRARDLGEQGLANNQTQKLYAAWNQSALRLTWSGADWETDGNLFIYLNTRPNGATRAYNPFSSTAGAVAVGLPFGADYLVRVADAENANLLTWNETTQQWEAVTDSLTYLYDSGARLTHLSIPFSALGITDPAANALGLLAFATEEDGLKLWASLPARNPANSLRLLGVSQPKGQQVFALTQALNWAALGAGVCPNNSLVLDPNQPPCLPARAPQGFSLPNAASATAAAATPIEASLADVRASVTSEPAGNTYSILGDGLFSLMSSLPQFAAQADWAALQADLCAANPLLPECARAGSSTNAPQTALADKLYTVATPPDSGARLSRQSADEFTRNPSLAQAILQTPRQPLQTVDLNSATALADTRNTAQAPVGDGQTVTYTLQLQNNGEGPSTGLVVDVLTFGPVRLPAGTPSADANGEFYHLTLNVGDLGPGEEQTLVITGVIDYAFDALNLSAGWATLDIVVYDNSGSFERNQIDWLFADFPLDLNGPTAVLRASPALLTPALNTFSGLVFDESPVPSVALEIRNQAGALSAQTCADDEPTDSVWSCAWNANGAANGAEFGVRARATDQHGQTGAWTRWLTFTVDATPPALNLSQDLSATLQSGWLNPTQAEWGGALTDNRLGQSVSVCDPTTGICESATVTLDPTTLPTTTYTYADQPDTPIALGAQTDCNLGQKIVRTFHVADGFTVGNVQVGLNITHPYRYDLSAWLQAPSGTWVTLLWNGTAAQNYNVLLDDAAPMANAADLTDHDPTLPDYPNALRPDGSLSLFAGEQAYGDWALILCDYYPAESDGAYNHSRLVLQSAALPKDTQAAWAYTVPMLDVADGVTRTLELYGEDSVGNRQTAPLIATFQLDNVAPVLTATTVAQTAAVGQVLQPSAPPTLGGTVSDGGGVASVVVLIATPSGQDQIANATLTGNSWAYRLTPMEEGTYTLRVAAVDAAGNVSAFQTFTVQAQGRWPLYLPLVQR